MGVRVRPKPILLLALAIAQQSHAKDSFLNTPLKAPVNPDSGRPDKFVYRTVTGLGGAAADTLANLSRFGSSLAKRDFLGALKSVRGIVFKRESEKIMEQFVALLPKVLEGNIDLNRGNFSSDALGKYLSNTNLDEKSAAELFRFFISQEPGSTAASRAAIVKEMREALQLLKKGSKKSSEQIGEDLSKSLAAAFKVNPPPLIGIGDPLNPARILGVSKSFVSSLIKTQSGSYVSAVVNQQRQIFAKSGVVVSEVSDKTINNSIDTALSDLQVENCIDGARDLGSLTYCGEYIAKNRNQIIGSVMSQFAEPLASGDVTIKLNFGGLDGPIEVGKIVGRGLKNNSRQVDALRFGGSDATLNSIVNSVSQGLVLPVGKTTLNRKLAGVFANEPERQALYGHTGETLLTNLQKELKVLDPNGGELFSQVESLMRSAEKPVVGDKLDQRIRGPFERTLTANSSRKALLDIVLDRMPVDEAVKEALRKTYAESLGDDGKLRLTSAKIPEGLKIFLQSFHDTIASVANVPKNQATITYLKDLANPQSTTINAVLAKMQQGTHHLFNFFLARPADQRGDYRLTADGEKIMDILRAGKNLTIPESKNRCAGAVEGLPDEFFAQLCDSDQSVIRNPYQVVAALGSNQSRTASNCVLAAALKQAGLADQYVSQ